MNNDQKTFSLLIVDDDPSILELLDDLLGANYRILTATGGPQALEMLAHITCDLILADLGMPGMSGAELVREIRASPRTCNTPIIAFSAYHQAAELTASLPVQAFIPKPFQILSLESAIQRVLAQFPSSSLNPDRDSPSITAYEPET